MNKDGFKPADRPTMAQWNAITKEWVDNNLAPKSDFDTYQKEAVSMKVSLDKFLETHTEIPPDVVLLLGVAYDGLGLGEAGEVQGKIKKIIRDNGGIIDEEAKTEIAKELGDVLWYIASMCENLGITLSEVARYNIEKLQSRHARGTVHGSGDNR